MSSDQTAADAFALLSDEIRVDCLCAVALAQHEQDVPGRGPAALSFSDVYERVDVDSTSKLSYHLGELTGTFLRKREERYSLTRAGEQMVRFVLAENYRPPSSFGPVETAGSCLFCGASALVAGLDGQYFAVQCSACERTVAGYLVTPAQTDTHDGPALLESLKRKQATEYGLVQAGTCPECGGHVESSVADTSELPTSDSLPFAFLANHECRACRRIYGGPLIHGVAYHPASVAFHWDHGVDVLATGIWEFNHHVVEDRWTSERIDGDAGAYRVTLRRGDDSLRLFLDEDGEVTRTERVRDRTLD